MGLKSTWKSALTKFLGSCLQAGILQTLNLSFLFPVVSLIPNERLKKSKVSESDRETNTRANKAGTRKSVRYAQYLYLCRRWFIS